MLLDDAAEVEGPDGDAEELLALAGLLTVEDDGALLDAVAVAEADPLSEPP